MKWKWVWQTLSSNAILLDDSIPADCLVKVVNTKDDMVYH